MKFLLRLEKQDAVTTACPLATSSSCESLILLWEFTAAQPNDLWGAAAAWALGVCL